MGDRGILQKEKKKVRMRDFWVGRELGLIFLSFLLGAWEAETVFFGSIFLLSMILLLLSFYLI